MTTERVNGLEGMRGLAAFLVYIHHFLLVFYPAFYFGPHNWMNHLFNPDLAVTWFFVHSGFVLSFKTRDLDGKDYYLTILDQGIRRYFRLVPLVLASILLTYVGLKLGWVSGPSYATEVQSPWLGRYLNFTPDLAEALKQAFYGVYFEFKSGRTYNPNLWTIGYELISSYVLFLCLCLFGKWKKSPWPYFILAFIFGPWKGMMSFLFGAFLTRIPEKKYSVWILLPLAVLGFYLSDLEGGLSPYARSIGAGILMFVLLKSHKLRGWLSRGPIKFLGDISYSLYVIHFLLLTTLTSFFGHRWNAQNSFWSAGLIFVITTIALIALSYSLWRFIDKPGISFAKKISQKFMGSV